MRRMFGMMPSAEIEKQSAWDDGSGNRCSIDAGPGGWTLHFADHSNIYRDVENGTEANHEEAHGALLARFPNAFEVKPSAKVEQ